MRRTSTTEHAKGDTAIEEESLSDATKSSRTFKKPIELQYVNIRRGRVSSTTEAPEENR